MAYVVEASDMMSFDKKSLVIDPKIVNEQDVNQLEQVLQQNGVKLANKVQFYIMVENEKKKIDEEGKKANGLWNHGKLKFYAS